VNTTILTTEGTEEYREMPTTIVGLAGSSLLHP
jgi:hypothetical protein